MFQHRAYGALRRRLERLERPHRCPVHPDVWLLCNEDAFDDTQLTEAERTELDDLLGRTLETPLDPIPAYGPCPRCRQPRYCLTCNAEAAAGESSLPGLTELESARVLELVDKAIRDDWEIWQGRTTR
jgi:hypothetical protein